MISPAGQLGSFSAPNSDSIAALADGNLVVASPGHGKLLHVFGPTGLLLARIGDIKSLDRNNATQNEFLNRGKVVVSPSGDIYYASTFSTTPVIQKFSGAGQLLAEFPVEGAAAGLQLKRAREFLNTKDSNTVGGYKVITYTAVDAVTGNLWVSLNGSSKGGDVTAESGVAYEYSPAGVKLAEYAFVTDPTSPSPEVITGVEDLAVSTPWVYLVTHDGRAYRFNLNNRLAQGGRGRKPEGRASRASLVREFRASDLVAAPPSLAEASCPTAVPFSCWVDCQSGSAPPTVDCAGEIKSRLIHGDTIISASCNVTGGPPPSCSATATSCNTDSGTRLTYSVSLSCNPPQTADNGDPSSQCPSPGHMDENGNCVGLNTPVLVDINGDGFAMTDAAGGVRFDLNGDGSAEQISWTAAGSDDAWLVLDRNGNAA